MTVSMFETGENKLTERFPPPSESRLSRSLIERAVLEAKAQVDSAYEYSRRE